MRRGFGYLSDRQLQVSLVRLYREIAAAADANESGAGYAVYLLDTAGAIESQLL